VAERLTAVPLQSLPAGFLAHHWHLICPSHAADPGLSSGHRHLLQRGEGRRALALSRDLCVQYETALVLSRPLTVSQVGISGER
jgi:hypothetical protein